jgi:NADH-quinone oxidoreductase subunit J
MMIAAAFFYLFAGLLVASAFMVIAAKNPVHSVLYLIFAFVNAAGLFMMMGAEFLAMILIVVYVGAVAVLFLFVVMMLDVDFAELKQGVLQYLPMGMLIGGIFLAELVLVVGAWVIGPGVPQAITAPIPAAISNTEAIGLVLYTRYVYYFQAAGMILLVSMIGAIVLTLQHRVRVRRQSIADQVARTPATSIEIRKCVRGRGSAATASGATHDHRPRPLSVGCRHPVHAGDFRHLPQPQERHHHPDVDRAYFARGQHQFGGVLDPSRRSGRPDFRAAGADSGGGGSGDRACRPRGLLPRPRLDRGRRHQSDEGLIF